MNKIRKDRRELKTKIAEILVGEGDFLLNEIGHPLRSSGSLLKEPSFAIDFLVCLFDLTQERIYLEGASRLAELSPTIPGATLLKLYKATKKKEYLSKIPWEYPACNSASRRLQDEDLPILLRLHSVTNEPWVLTEIDFLVLRILKKAVYIKDGLYWPPEGNKLPGSANCHGFHWLKFIFLELGFYFRNEAFLNASQNISFQNTPTGEAPSGSTIFTSLVTLRELFLLKEKDTGRKIKKLLGKVKPGVAAAAAGLVAFEYFKEESYLGIANHSISGLLRDAPLISNASGGPHALPDLPEISALLFKFIEPKNSVSPAFPVWTDH